MFRERIEKRAPSIIERDSINTAVETGQLVIDSLFPIGRGQRQLIIGDRKTGKSTIALDTMLTQKKINNNLFLNSKINLFSILVSVGQKQSDVLNILLFCRDYFLGNSLSLVLANAASAAPLQYIAPFVGCTIGEFFRNNGLSALVVYDDLSKHAVAYRQLALLLRRPPGREAFPSDIFYLHARLLERAGRLAYKYSGGSLTALPVVETQAGDISAYIPTNIISITDGQLFLDYELFSKGHRPAIHTGLSVSRIGSSAQSKLMKKSVGPFKLLVAQLKQLERFESFASDLDESIRNDILRGKVITSLLKQLQHVIYPIFEQVLLILLSINIELEDLANLSAADYGYYFKDLIRFLFDNVSTKAAWQSIKKDLYYGAFFDFLKFCLKSRRALKIAAMFRRLKKYRRPPKNYYKFRIENKALVSKLVLNALNQGCLTKFNLLKNKKEPKFLGNSAIVSAYLNNKINILLTEILKPEDTQDYLCGIYASSVNLKEFNFNYWTSMFFLPFFVSSNFIFNLISDFFILEDTNIENSSFLSFLNTECVLSDLISPFLNLKDQNFYFDETNLNFLIDLLSFVGLDNYLENKIYVTLMQKYYKNLKRI